MPDAMTIPNPLEQLSLAQLRRRTSEKWRSYPEDVLPLFVAEMDATLAPPVIEAVERAVREGDTGYAIGTAYAEALHDFAAERWEWRFPIPATRLVTDVMGGIAELLRWNTRRDDAVVIASPVYMPFHWVIERIGRRLVHAPLTREGRHDPEALDRAFAEAAETSHAPVFLMCNPHNPTGVVHAPEELETVARLAARHGVTVLSDEIHAPIVRAGVRHTPYLTVAERIADEEPAAARALTIISASKAWNLPGMKAGLVIAARSALNWVRRIPEFLPGGPSHLGVLAHVAAFREGGPWLDALLSALDANHALLQQLLAERLPGVTAQAAEGTYLAWLDCRGLEFGVDPARHFRERGCVALNDGRAFGPGGEGHVRLNFATRQDILREAIERMAASLPGEQTGSR